MHIEDELNLVNLKFNSLIAKYTQGETEEGFKGDLIERAGFKVNKFFGGEWSKREMEFAAFQKKSNKDIVNEHRKKMGLPPMTAEQEKRLETKNGPTVPNASQMMSQQNQTATVVPESPTQELESLNKLGESIKNTPSSEAQVMKQQYEQMLNNGKEPGEIVAEKLANKLDDSNYFLNVIAGNTAPNKSLQSNPMTNRMK
jgi:hypothetical protein